MVSTMMTTAPVGLMRITILLRPWTVVMEFPVVLKNMTRVPDNRLDTNAAGGRVPWSVAPTSLYNLQAEVSPPSPLEM